MVLQVVSLFRPGWWVRPPKQAVPVLHLVLFRLSRYHPDRFLRCHLSEFPVRLVFPGYHLRPRPVYSHPTLPVLLEIPLSPPLVIPFPLKPRQLLREFPLLPPFRVHRTPHHKNGIWSPLFSRPHGKWGKRTPGLFWRYAYLSSPSSPLLHPLPLLSHPHPPLPP